MTRTRRTPLSLLLALSLSACATGGAPSRAGEVAQAVTLDAISYGTPGRPAGDLLISVSEALPTASQGSLQLRLGPEPDSGLPDTSADALTAVRSGAVDLAVVSAHTLADAGVRGLRAFQAPGLLTSRAAAAAALADPVVDQSLESAQVDDVVPVGVSFEDFRFPAAWDEPLLDPASWAGRRVATKPGMVLVALIDAMGATPDFRNGQDLTAAVESTEVTGGFYSLGEPSSPVEGAILTVNALQTVRIDVVVVNAKVYAGLNAQQTSALRAAVRSGAEVQAPLRRPALADQAAAYCAQMSGSVALATPQQIAESKRAVARVHRWLESDPTTKTVIERFQALAAAAPVESISAPCSAPGAMVRLPPLDPVGDQTVVDGVWRITVREATLVEAGWPAVDVANNTGVWTITFDHGTYKVVEPSGRSCTGSIVVASDKLQMLGTSPGCEGDRRLLFRRDGDTLHARGDHDAAPAEAPFHDVMWSAGLTRLADAP